MITEWISWGALAVGLTLVLWVASTMKPGPAEEEDDEDLTLT